MSYLVLFICLFKWAFVYAHFEIKLFVLGVWGFFAFRYWNGKVDLNITSPTLTDVCLHYQESENHFSSSVASPAIGTVVIDVKNISNTLLGWNLYYRPQVSPI